MPQIPYKQFNHVSMELYYNLFKLFFLASIFFLSAWAFAKPTSFFWVLATAAAAAVDPLTPVSVVGAMAACCSCPFPRVEIVEGASGDGNGNAALGAVLFWSALRTEVLVWSTFSAVVDSEIAPDLNLGFGLAWIPV